MKKLLIICLLFSSLCLLCLSVSADNSGTYNCTMLSTEYTGAGEITSFDVNASGMILVNIRAATNIDGVSQKYFTQLYDSNFKYIKAISYKTAQYAVACFDSNGNIEILGYRMQNAYVYNWDAEFLYKRDAKEDINLDWESITKIESVNGYYLRNIFKTQLSFVNLSGEETKIVSLSDNILFSFFKWFKNELVFCCLAFLAIFILWRWKKSKRQK